VSSELPESFQRRDAFRDERQKDKTALCVLTDIAYSVSYEEPSRAFISYSDSLKRKRFQGSLYSSLNFRLYLLNLRAIIWEMFCERKRVYIEIITQRESIVLR
jgi:hypothetical protein